MKKIRINNIALPLATDFSDNGLISLGSRLLKVNKSDISSAKLHKRSVDARNKNNVHFLAAIDVSLKVDEQSVIYKSGCKNAVIVDDMPYSFTKCNDVKGKKTAVIGTGPAGIFAAYTLCLAGIKPIMFERGDMVDKRIDAVEKFKKDGILDCESNIQFGEGGAGTFSDGKLNTGIKDKRIRAVLETFVKFGAPQEILWQSKPHIGTDILRKVVKNMRLEIEKMGGEYRFRSAVTKVNIKDNKLKSLVILNDEKEYEESFDYAVLAVGHSARDTFYSLYNSGIEMVQKNFAVGVRIEHLQSMINKAQYGKFADSRYLSPADYKLAVRLKSGRGVYTFCMCPGGYVVPAASEKNSVVTNGMSNFLREGDNANSAVLLGVGHDDFDSDSPLAGIEFQRKIEQAAYKVGGENYFAPVQTVGSFLHGGKNVAGSVKPTYTPSVKFTDISPIFPQNIVDDLKCGIRLMNTKIHGFADNDAIITAPESRSSSPVRIVRDDSKNSVSAEGLLPCGEGAGYAGGITSAAVDGISCAESIIEK